ncbi:hypothetical protein CLOP_g2300 [Closterium sp. NIES-67]|nr:hypothetical protein CLOP_g2300 [Closterium sp. NIES-67]
MAAAHLDMEFGAARMLMADYGGLTVSQLHQQFPPRNLRSEFPQQVHKHEGVAGSNASLLQQHQQHQQNQRQQQQHHEQQQQRQSHLLESKPQRALDPSQARPPGGKYLSRWTSEEDAILLAHVTAHGTTNWGLLKSSGLLPYRDNKACCNRFILLKKKFLELSPSADPAMSPAAPSWADVPKPPNSSAPGPSPNHRAGSAPTRGVMAQVGTASFPLPLPPAVGATAPSVAAAGGGAAAGSSADRAASAPADAASGSAALQSASDQPKAEQEGPGVASATCSGTGRGSGGCGSTTLGPCAPDDDADGEHAGSAEVLRPSSLFDSIARGAASATGASGGGLAGIEWETAGLSHKRALSDGGRLTAAGAAASATVGAHSDLKRLRRFVSAGRPPLRADVSPQSQRLHGASLGSAADGAGLPRAMSLDGKSTGGGSATGTPGGSTTTTGAGDVDMDVAGMVATAAATAAATALSASTSTSAVSALRRLEGRYPGSGLCASPIPRSASAYRNRPPGMAADGPSRSSCRTLPSADMRSLCNMLGLDATAPPPPVPEPAVPFPLPPAGPSAHSQRRSSSPLQHASLRKHHSLPNHTVPSLLAKLRRSHGHASAAGGGSGTGSRTPPLGSSAASVRQLMKALGLPPVPSPPQSSLLHSASPTAVARNETRAAFLPDAAALSAVVGGLQAQLHAKQQQEHHQQADPSELAAAASGGGVGTCGFPTSVDGLFDWISQPVGADPAAFHNAAFPASMAADGAMDSAALSAAAAAGEGVSRRSAGAEAWRSSAGAGMWTGPSAPDSGGALAAGLLGGLSTSAADVRGSMIGHSAGSMRSASPTIAAAAGGTGGPAAAAAAAAACEAFNLSVVRQSYLESLKDVPGVADMLSGTPPKPKDAFACADPGAASAAPVPAGPLGDVKVCKGGAAAGDTGMAAFQERELLLLQQQEQEFRLQLQLQLQQQVKVERGRTPLEDAGAFLSSGQLMFLQHQQSQQQHARMHKEMHLHAEALKLSQHQHQHQQHQQHHQQLQQQQQLQLQPADGGGVDYGSLLQELLLEAQAGKEDGEGRRPDHLLEMMSA